jgi:rhamnosyltransferase
VVGDTGGSTVTGEVNKSAFDVSVTFLTRNGGATLKRALQAVRDQATDRRVEIVAVDSGSTDSTLANLEAHDTRVFSIDPESFNFGTARDRAFDESKAPIVVTLSQDAIPADDTWIESLVAPLDESDAAVSCGKSIPDPHRGFHPFAWERNGYFYFTREMRKFANRFGRGLSFSNAAVRREVWQSLRIDAQPVGEDYQFQTKLHAANERIAFAPEAQVYHHHTYTTRRLVERCRNEGLGLRLLGCPYTEWDLANDLVSPRKYVQWAREVRHRRIRSFAEAMFPVVRPLAVYAGSRFGRRAVWS